MPASSGSMRDVGVLDLGRPAAGVASDSRRPVLRDPPVTVTTPTPAVGRYSTAVHGDLDVVLTAVASLYCIWVVALYHAALWACSALMRASQLPLGPAVQVFESFSTKVVDVVVDSVSSARVGVVAEPAAGEPYRRHAAAPYPVPEPPEAIWRLYRHARAARR